jgi:hypothetical protein
MLNFGSLLQSQWRAKFLYVDMVCTEANLPKKEFRIDLSETFLKNLFEEAEKSDEILWPDEAIKQLATYWGEVKKNNPSSFSDENASPIHRDKLMSEAKRIHKFAVDLFYKTYAPQKKGAPPMTEDYAKFILGLDKEGLSHREIAERLGMQIDNPEDASKAKDKVRHRIKAAKKRIKK